MLLREIKGEEDHEAARTRTLFRDRRSAGVALAARAAPYHLAGGQSRSMGDRAADGAAGIAGADRRRRDARSAQLELARIWDARRRVALLRSLRSPQHSDDALDQRECGRDLSARRRGGA